jgi:hypothetical protein
MKTRKNLLFLALILILATLACSWGAVRSTEISPAVLYTQAAETLRAQLTRDVNIYTFATMTALVAPPSATLTPLPAFATSLPPTNTSQIPTVTPIPTNTPVPPQNTSSCNQATFIKDVTVGDGTVFTPGTEFTKIWRLKNTGKCSWDKK